VTGRELALRAAALAAEVGNHEIEARAWHRCAYTAVHVGLAEQSVKECDLALRAARRSGDLGLQSTIARQKGNVLREINRMAGSMRWYERGVLLARRAGQPELEAMAINNIGILALWMGRFDRAASAFARAIELKRRSGLSASLRVTQSNVVAALVASGDHVRARALLEEVIPAESPDEGPMVICASFANLAETYLAEDDLGRAAELYERAYSLGSERGNLQMAGYPLHGLVRAEVMRGGAFLARAKERIPQLAELAALFKQERTRLHVAEAVIADAEGRIADALASCQRAWELRSSARYQWGFVGSTIEIHWLRAILFARAGREAAARRAAEGARKKLLSMADHIASPERRRRALEVPPIHHAILHGRLDTPLGWAWMPRATS
jgi:tetratricopeptide (TPR) repeat protein